MMMPLSKNQQKLADKIIEVCNKVHKRDHVTGFEVVLFKACTNQAKIDKVSYFDLAELIHLSAEAEGWFLWIRDKPVFRTKEDWDIVLRSFI